MAKPKPKFSINESVVCNTDGWESATDGILKKGPAKGEIVSITYMQYVSSQKAFYITLKGYGKNGFNECGFDKIDGTSKNIGIGKTDKKENPEPRASQKENKNQGQN